GNGWGSNNAGTDCGSEQGRRPRHTGRCIYEAGDIRQTISDIRKLTDKPFAVNLFCVDNSAEPVAEKKEAVMTELLKIGKNLDVSEADIQFNAADYFNEQVRILIEEKVPVISTAF